MSNSSNPDNGKFSMGQMASRDLPLSRTHRQTDKCKVSIMKVTGHSFMQTLNDNCACGVSYLSMAKM